MTGMTRMLIAIAALPLLGCQSQAAGQDVEPEAVNVGGLVLGQSFNEVVSIVGVSSFNHVAMRECLSELPIRGCFLSRSEFATPLVIASGVPLNAQVTLNSDDQLVNLSLIYDFSGDVSRAECVNVAERVLAWVEQEYGALPLNPRARSGARESVSIGTVIDETGGWIAERSKGPAGGRRVSFLAHHFRIDRDFNCQTVVSFSDESLKPFEFERPSDDRT